MKLTIFFALSLIVLLWVASLMLTQRAAYNCALAEFHPDYPIEVKQMCREKNEHNIK